MKTLAKHNRDKLIDLLSERLAFERSGVKLYDTIISKLGSRISDGQGFMSRLRLHRDQEKEHEEWLESQIRALGGTAHERTDLGELITREAKGIEEVIQQDDSPVHLLHALLTAELVDKSGWDLLVILADEAGDQDALREFELRNNHEAEHLMFAREAIAAYTRTDVLGASMHLPTSP